MIPSQTWQKGCGGIDGSSPLNKLSSSNWCTINLGTHNEYLHLVHINSIKSSSLVKPSSMLIIKPPISFIYYELLYKHEGRLSRYGFLEG